MNWVEKHIGLIVFLMIVLFIAMPFIFTRNNFLGFDFSNSGQIGDTIGGTTAPIIGLVSCLLLYFSFKAQINANKQTNDGLIQQQKINQLERNFDFILIEINNFSCTNLGVYKKIYGLDAFEYMFSNFSNLDNIKNIDIRALHSLIVAIDSIEKKMSQFESNEIQVYKDILAMKYHNSFTRYMPDDIETLDKALTIIQQDFLNTLEKNSSEFKSKWENIEAARQILFIHKSLFLKFLSI